MWTRGKELKCSYVRLIDSCITQLKAQGPSRTCGESEEEGVYLNEERVVQCLDSGGLVLKVGRGVPHLDDYAECGLRVYLDRVEFTSIECRVHIDRV